MKKIILFILLFLSSLNCYSNNGYLHAGLGLNTSHITSENTDANTGWGLGFKTELGYHLEDNYSFEIGSIINFNKVGSFDLWTTLFTLGIRKEFKSYENHEAFFTRVFLGKGPTVAFVNGDLPEHLKQFEADADRLQNSGPVIGIGLGQVRRLDQEIPYFIELMITAQRLESQELIKNDKDTPVVLEKRSLKDTSIYTLTLTWGLFVFE